MANYFKKELSFKVLFLGDYGVGKTSIIQRYTEGTFTPHYKITIGADFALKQIEWDSETRVNLQLWDIAGHERFGALTTVYYRYAVAAAIVFDLTRPETFKSVAKWLHDVMDKTTLQHGKTLPVILLANKGDVVTNNIPPDIIDFCNKHHILTWFKTSAKENTNIDNAMNLMLSQILANHENNNMYNSDSVILQEKPPTEQQNTRCCSR